MRFGTIPVSQIFIPKEVFLRQKNLAKLSQVQMDIKNEAWETASLSEIFSSWEFGKEKYSFGTVPNTYF